MIKNYLLIDKRNRSESILSLYKVLNDDKYVMVDQEGERHIITEEEVDDMTYVHTQLKERSLEYFKKYKDIFNLIEDCVKFRLCKACKKYKRYLPVIKAFPCDDYHVNNANIINWVIHYGIYDKTSKLTYVDSVQIRLGSDIQATLETFIKNSTYNCLDKLK